MWTSLVTPYWPRRSRTGAAPRFIDASFYPLQLRNGFVSFGKSVPRGWRQESLRGGVCLGLANAPEETASSSERRPEPSATSRRTIRRGPTTPKRTATYDRPRLPPTSRKTRTTRFTTQRLPHQGSAPCIIPYILCTTPRPGDLLLDPFCGSGMTGVAAQMCANPPAGHSRIVPRIERPRWPTCVPYSTTCLLPPATLLTTTTRRLASSHSSAISSASKQR